MDAKKAKKKIWTSELIPPSGGSLREVAFELNKDGQIKELEPSCWNRIFEGPIESCLGRNLADFFHQEDQAKFEASLSQVASGEKLFYNHQLRFAKIDGKPIWVEVFVRTFKDKEGKIQGLIGTLTDIAERKEIAQNAEERNQIIFSFFEDSPHMMAVAEVENDHVHFLFCNLQQRKYMAEEIGSQKVLDVVGLNWRQKIEESKTSQKTVHFEYSRDTKKGPRYFSCSLTYIGPGANPNATRFSYIVTDLTENRRNEQLLEEQKAKLIHAAKMSSLGEMASGIAHEVNNPLAIIQGAAQVLRLQLQMGAFSEESFLEKIGKIESTVGRISKIISALRSYARDGSQDPVEPCAVSKIVQDTVELCQNRFSNHGIDLHVQCPDNIRIHCRPVQISQVLINLLNNAFDAVSALPQKWVSLNVREQQGKLLFEVTDSGPGIPAAVQERMMNPFFTTKEVGQGTGLGLSLSKSLVEGHQGSLQYDPTCANTRFVVSLPFK